MAIQWVLLGSLAAAEAILIALLVLPPRINPLRRVLISAIKAILQPLSMVVISFCVFLFADIYLKYKSRIVCYPDRCSYSDLMRYQRSVMKSQRNFTLLASALIFNLLLRAMIKLEDRIDELERRIHKSKELKHKD